MGSEGPGWSAMKTLRIALSLGIAMALILGAVAVWMLGYPTHPDRLLLIKRGVELVDFADYAPNRARPTPAIALTFEGSAPFAAIRHAGHQAQFRCHVVSAAGSAQTDMAFGWVLFCRPSSAASGSYAAASWGFVRARRPLPLQGSSFSRPQGGQACQWTCGFRPADA